MSTIKGLITAFSAVLVLSTFALVFPINIGTANGYSIVSISGTIKENTEWTRDNFYNVTGNVVVANGVTLTIDPGTAVGIVYPYQIIVNGTLIARGTNTNQIAIHSYGIGDGGINFTQFSKNWNEQMASGSIIEHTIFVNDVCGVWIQVNNVSPKLSNNEGLGWITVYGGSPIISNNQDGSFITIADGSPIILNNTLSGPGTIIDIHGGSPVISNNTIDYSIPFDSNTGNGAEGIALDGPNNALISDNVFQTLGIGIGVSAGNPSIERNSINNCYRALTINGDATPIIENNTLIDNYVGVNMYSQSGVSPSPTISNNNIAGSHLYNIYLGQQGLFDSTAPNLNAAQNWWGTTDVPTIKQTIYDSKNNNNVGTVNITPILTMPNPEAKPDPNASTTLSNTNTATYNISTNIVIIASLSLIIIAILAFTVIHRKKKKSS